MKNTICLVMIVKNESHIIKPLLEAVIPYIDYWVISDTGSTDGTQDLIKNTFHGKVPGELHERPWVDFGHNRTEVLQLADGKAEYMWMIDADDFPMGTPQFQGLTADSYLFTLHRGPLSYWRKQLFKSGLDWRYIGVLHEYPYSALEKSEDKLGGDFFIEARCMGSRSTDPDKYLKDATTLEEALVKEPENDRYRFYLANSYFDARKLILAIENYERRITMQGWDEEVFYCYYRIGLAKIALQRPEMEVVEALLKAYDVRPSRAEPLHVLAVYYRDRNKLNLAHLWAEAACTIPYPENDILFVEPDVYEYKILDELTSAGYYTVHAKACYPWMKVLATKNLPETYRERVNTNLHFYRERFGNS